MSQGSKAKQKGKKVEKVGKPWKIAASYKKSQITEVHARSDRSDYRCRLWKKQHGVKHS